MNFRREIILVVKNWRVGSVFVDKNCLKYMQTFVALQLKVCFNVGLLFMSQQRTHTLFLSYLIFCGIVIFF